MPQSLDGLHIILINGIIVFRLSEWIEFNFDRIVNTRYFLLVFRVYGE